MELMIFQVDVFVDSFFQGNLVVVCFFDVWLDDECLQVIVEENNFLEIVFVVGCDGDY